MSACNHCGGSGIGLGGLPCICRADQTMWPKTLGLTPVPATPAPPCDCVPGCPCPMHYHFPSLPATLAAPVPEDREEAPPGVAAMAALIASYRLACEEWGATSADAWRERVTEREEALTTRAVALEEENKRLRLVIERAEATLGWVNTEKCRAMAQDCRAALKPAAAHGHTEGANG